MQAFTIVLAVALAGMSVPPAGAQLTATRDSGSSRYRSAFDDYRPFKDQPPASWRAVNDEVARVGGHAGALKASGGSLPARPGEQRPAAPTTNAPGGATAPSHSVHH